MARVLRGRPLGDLPKENTLDGFLFNIMKRNRDKIYLSNASSGAELTFGQVLDTARGIATGLRRLGYGKGDILTLYANNSEEFVMVSLGALHAGVIVNTINPATTSYELRHYLKDVQPKIIFTETPLLQNITAALEVVREKPKIIVRERTPSDHLSVHDLIQENLTEQEVVRPRVDAKNDIAFIFYSSGTTGLPKGVMLTHYNVISYLITNQQIGFWPLSATKCLNLFPMYHVGGIILAAFLMILTESNLIFLEKMDLGVLLRSIQERKPECAFLPSSVVVRLSKTPLGDDYDVSSLQSCLYGGAPLKEEIEALFRSRFNDPFLQPAYGMTECCATIVVRTETTNREGSVGKIITGSEIKIVSPDTGELRGPNERGEILIRSPLVMKGYLNNPEATRVAVDENGWLHSGDLGYYDEDEYLFVVDRIKDLIKYHGFQVAPAELEALLLEHPSVSDTAVVGVPDDDAGELPRAYVVGKPNCELTEEDLQQFVNDRAADYKRLRGGIVFVSAIPKLASGKILRRKLHAIATGDDKV